MIKLNNNKITYVALADTNNSVKGVKEIWYADTNNSVKLVYRRKDALIEGEDYEVHDWLVGDGTARIVKNFNFWQNKLEVEVGDEQGNQFSTNYNETGVYVAAVYNNGGGNPYMLVSFRETTSGHIGDVLYSQFPERLSMVFYIEDGIAYCNQNGTLHTGQQLTESIWNKDIPLRINAKKMAYIRELLPNDTYRSNFIPCKLLKPVPKWLDANGIRRQVGECGMIDLVSGKFYGNVNSVGTFTVENYYERKEWLQGRNGAYIDTNYIVSQTDHVNCHYKYDGTMRNPDDQQQIIFGTNANNNYCRAYINSDNNLSVQFFLHINRWYTTNKTVLDGDITDLHIEGQNYYFSVNGESYNFPTNFETFNVDKSIWLFGYNKDDSTNLMYFHGDIASFSIRDASSVDKVNMIPCTLTMDLPASMDANNIARTKGTSGMWDLVSDRFYGNVANSGTFKAVNLAEGVDYEVHDWLVGDGSAYIDTLVALKDVTTYSIKAQKDEYFMKSLFGANDGESDRLNVTTYSTDNGYWRVVFGATQTNLVPFSSDAIEIEWDGNDVYVDNVLKTTISYTSISNMTCTLFTCKGVPDYRIFDGKIASLTITSKINFIPVKLLRSIPAKYDANGIARNAGECGMYDTVNDVFYGNMANSGSFTVSND